MRSVEEQLTAPREIKRRRIESYVDNELRFTVAIGGLPETTEATKALIAAYREMRAETQANPAATQADTVALEAWRVACRLPVTRIRWAKRTSSSPRRAALGTTPHTPATTRF
jgi:hypothetical protein